MRSLKIPYSDSELFHSGARRTFKGKALSQIAFPLGGIGTGTISLGGRGELRDWEIFNRPGKGVNLPFSFFALKVKEKDKEPLTRILESRLLPPYANAHGLPLSRLSGLPRMYSAKFIGSYPFAEIEFFEPLLPVRIKLCAFNPFIPLNDFDSGLPVVIFYFTIENFCEKEVEILLTGSLLNAVGYDGKAELNDTLSSLFGSNLNEFIKDTHLSGIRMTSSKYPLNDPKYGSMALVTPWKNITYRLRWKRDGWGAWEKLQNFWSEFKETDRFPEETEALPTPEGETDIATLGLILKLAPKEKYKVPFILSWYFPNFVKYWKLNSKENIEIFKTYYSTKFNDAWEVAKYTVNNLSRLESETKAFQDTLFQSTLPSYVLDAVSSQASIIRTNTCFRLADGNFYGFEGCSNHTGCCPLNCTHVWNYEQALAFLFPELERTMREIDFLANTDNSGKMSFRTVLPLSAKRWESKPAADGQMGSIIKLYREWKFSGNTEFLSRLWPKAKKSLEFAWKWWDKNKDGVMEGEQHNTYDIEFYGPNSMMGTLYLGALKAAKEIAIALKDKKSAKEYEKLFKKGSEILDKELFNGKYYIQKYDSSKISKYQYGEGCLSDQLLGQWFARVVGLGELLPKKHIDSALSSIFKYNWRENFFEHHSCQRIYALNEEKGLLVCSWPQGKRPKVPFPYCDEVWTGIEYQVASHLIYEGFLREGLAIVKGVQERYNGIKRNPWNEFECGYHYVRAMSSWSLILALSGYSFNAPKHSLGFEPRINFQNFRSFFSTNTGWGEFSQRTTKNFYEARLRIIWGSLKISSLTLKIPKEYKGPYRVSLFTKEDEKDIPVSLKENCFIFPKMVELKKNEELKLVQFLA